MAAGEEGKANEAKTPMRRTRKTAEELTNAVLPEGIIIIELILSPIMCLLLSNVIERCFNGEPRCSHCSCMYKGAAHRENIE